MNLKLSVNGFVVTNFLLILEKQIILFKNKKQEITKHLKFRISGQKIIPTMSVKYLGVFLNDSLSWNTHLNTLIPKRNRAIGLAAEIQHYTSKYLLKTIYYSLFNWHLIYPSQTWGQSKSDHFRKLVELALQNILIKDFFNEEPPKPLNGHLKKLNDQHQHATLSSTHNTIFVPRVHIGTYGKNSIKYQSTNLWNNLNQILQIDLLQQTRGGAEKLIFEHSFNNYWKQLKIIPMRIYSVTKESSLLKLIIRLNIE